MTNPQPDPPASELLADALIDVGCQIATILDHMHASRRAATSAPDAPDPVDILRGLLRETLESVFGEDDDHQVRLSALVVAEVATTIHREIYLVPLSGQARPRRARRRRGRC